MVKAGGTLTKLKSAIKRWPSISKLGRSSSSMSVAAVSDGANIGEDISKELHTVYVGKSRRPYFVSLDVIAHPLFQELVDKSASDNDGAVVVSCEVVMFEHLLWMLENAATQLGSTEELVEFYTC
ncbi:Auxin-responsive protein SAUR78, partial [Cucurbita argyrosperma subsp. sororia]